jgi:hypothetical protein
MNKKREDLIDRFLESHNMDYLFCILAEKESERLTSLPDSIKRNFNDKITTMSLQHIALNDVPDYIVEEVEAEKEELTNHPEYVEEYIEEYKDRLDDHLDNYDSYDNFDDDSDLDDDEADDYEDED